MKKPTVSFFMILCAYTQDLFMYGEKYIWKVKVHLDMTLVALGWYEIILAPKLTNKAKIVSDVQQLHF